MKPRLPNLLLLLLLLPGCGAGDATPEDVAREYFAACDARDWDAVWDLGAAPYRNLWAETRDDLLDPPPYDLWLPTAGVAEVVTPKNGIGMTPREIHNAVNDAGAKKSAPLGEPGPEDLEIHLDGDRAEVSWAAKDARVFLVREDGAWRVLALGLASRGDVFVKEGPGSRQYAIWEFTDLFVKPRFDGLDLPRLPGDRDVGLADQGSFGVRLARDGRTEMRGELVGPDDLVSELVRWADIRRDMDEPTHPSRVRLDLGIDRTTPWAEVERVLRAAAIEPRSRDAVLWTVETRDGDLRGVPATLAARFSPARKRVRHEPIPLCVSILRPPTDEELAGLVGAIRARPSEERDAGLHVTLAGDLTAEQALRSLIALATATKGPFVLEPSVTGAVEAPSLNEEPVAPADSAGLFPEQAELRLIFEF